MATAPADHQRRLLDVQALDSELARIERARRSLPAATEMAEVDERLAGVADRAAIAGAEVSDARREVVKAETDVEQVRSREQRDHDRLAAGHGTAKDLQGLQSELEALGKRRGVLEDVQLEAMERLEGAERALEAIEAERAELQGARERLGGDVAEAYADLDLRSQQTAEQRAVAADGLDAGLMALYERLRAQLGGVGAAALRGRRCEGCSLELNPADLADIRAAAPDQIVRCEECGRILVRREDA